MPIFNDDVLNLYSSWPAPTVIISDGAYGVSGFPGDPSSHKKLPDWYEPHIKAWSHAASPRTTLWFWNTEIGWATVHPILEREGWIYWGTNVWDKGIAHVAGNFNGKTARMFPIVTELCVKYVREPLIEESGERKAVREWLRSEWKRTGLPFSKANEACGVADAATRKYLTLEEDLWYPPPDEVFEKLVKYANEQGNKEGRPYFVAKDLSVPKLSRFREIFKYRDYGISNVWKEPAVNGKERIKLGGKAAHLNQKPGRLIRLILEASTDPESVVWEPFGGLCTAAIASKDMGLPYYSAEIDPSIYKLALERLSMPLFDAPAK